MWRIAPAGDRALLVTLSATIDPDRLAEVLGLERSLMSARPPGLLSTVAAYASLLCNYDPALTDGQHLSEAIASREALVEPISIEGAALDVPTRYDGADLDEVAARTGLTPAGVIDQHAAGEYLVYCVGFAPGFTYCGELPRSLALPRRDSPRAHVPAGSVAIAGRQTGIYAVESPGGWHLIGRTTLRLFDPSSDPPSRFKPGDRLRFVPERD